MNTNLEVANNNEASKKTYSEDDENEECPTEGNLNHLEEQKAYIRIEDSFRHYRSYALNIVRQKRQHYESVKPHHKAILPNYEGHFDRMVQCIEANAKFLQEVIDYSSQCMFYTYWPMGRVPELQKTDSPTLLDMDKVLSTFRQFVRDWGDEGQGERDACYQPILDQLDHLYPDVQARHGIKVLIPGAGLSRLSYEIYVRGFCAQGTEFSHHMLICGSFILNHIERHHSYVVYPYVHHVCNNRDREDMLRGIAIPDVAPIEEVSVRGDPGGSFSMCAGDFLEIYNKPSERHAWDVMVTCFFLDTAHNVFDYVETVAHALAPGGAWINIGPLLWHFADQLQEVSVELSWSEVRQVIVSCGFQIVEERDVLCNYTTNVRSLMRQTYTAIYFYAVKKE